ncbi:serine hydrolase [Acaryochloris sp. IP29b_bin.137]|uniref:serine hydrolase n=1 Tax=Acaryochloris sp. IP29b_bin.137 TaxID=2969217 RepID=UPI00261B33E2|nr:serine hydrolase [Acaryochloris sp. IP29b_bin.137]
MVKISLSTSTTFDGDLNALVEDQETSLTVRFDLDDVAPADGLRVFLDSDVPGILNRLDFPALVANPQLENIDFFPLPQRNDDRSGVALTISPGAEFATFTINIRDDEDTVPPQELFDGLVEAEFSLIAADQIPTEDQASIVGISDYTVDANAASSTVLFVDTESQLPGNLPEPPEPPTPSNVAPVASNDSYSATAGETLSVDAVTGLLANDNDGDGDSLTVAISSDATISSISLNDDGSFSYTPKADFVGVDRFSYAVSDGNGGSDTADVSINVMAEPDELPGGSLEAPPTILLSVNPDNPTPPGPEFSGSPVEYATALVAKEISTRVFGANGDIQPTLATEVALLGLAASGFTPSLIEVTIDEIQKTVTVSHPGLPDRTAIHTESQGSIILPVGVNDLAFTPQSIEWLGPPEDALWPLGETIVEGDSLIDKTALEAALDAHIDRTGIRAIAVVHQGELVGERYAPGYGPLVPQRAWSTGKSVVATAIGRMIDQGYLDLDQRIPVEAWANDERQQITIRNLLNMSSGLDQQFDRSLTAFFSPDNEHTFIYSEGFDTVADAVEVQPGAFAPGTEYAYRNANPLIATAVARLAFAKATSQDELAFFAREVFEPLGMRSSFIETDFYGNFLSSGAFYSTARDLARLALVHLQKGMFGGTQVLSEEWTNFVYQPSPGREDFGAYWRNNINGALDLPTDAFFASGGFGQRAIAIPSRDLVISQLAFDPLTGDENFELFVNEVVDIVDTIVPTEEVTFNFDWTGQIAGFSIEGSFSFDASQTYTDGIVREEDLTDFDVSFFDPDGNLLRTYEENHLTFPEFNFAFDTNTQEILQDGFFLGPDGINIGEKTPVGDGFSGLNFWSRPEFNSQGEVPPPHLHFDDWADEFGFPIGFSSHEDVAFLTRTTQELLDTGRVGETYIGNTRAGLDELGQRVQISEVDTPSDSSNLVAGSSDDDALIPTITPSFDGSNDLVFAGAGNDEVDTPLAGQNAGGNRIDLGSGDDIVYVADGDRAFGSDGNDVLDATDASNYRISGGLGDDDFYLGSNGRALGGEGNDRFFASLGGDNLIAGGEGADQFWIVNGEVPTSANTIMDFELGVDVIGISGLGGLSFRELTLTNAGNNTEIAIDGTVVAQVLGTTALDESNFAFVA